MHAQATWNAHRLACGAQKTRRFLRRVRQAQRERLGRQRTAEQVTLVTVAPLRVQEGVLCLRLHTLGHDAQAEILRQRDHR